jgi:hypothetical protein
MQGYSSVLQSDSFVVGFCWWGFGATKPEYDNNALLPQIEAAIMQS